MDIHAGYEVFHADRSYIYSKARPEKTAELYNLYRIDADAPDRDRRLADVAHEDPITYIDDVARLCDQPVLAYKIFHNHLRRALAVELLANADLGILLKRRFLDVYVSMQKSRVLDESRGEQVARTNLDTSDVRIHFDVEEFQRKKAVFDRWYHTASEVFREAGVPAAEISYEQLHALSRIEQQDLLQEIFRTKLKMELPTTAAPIEDHRKQDTSSSYASKISNYDEVAAFIAEHEAV